MSEMTRAELVAYCEENDLDYAGNAGKNKLQEIVEAHKASLPEVAPVAELQAETPPVDETPNETPNDQESDSEGDVEMPETTKGKAYVNKTGLKFRVFDTWLKPGEKITPTESQLKIAKNVKRAKRAVKLGMLREV
jgi:hypothetical protein